MAKLITNSHGAVEIYFESGSARLQFKEGEGHDSQFNNKSKEYKGFIPDKKSLTNTTIDQK